MIGQTFAIFISLAMMGDARSVEAVSIDDDQRIFLDLADMILSINPYSDEWQEHFVVHLSTTPRMLWSIGEGVRITEDVNLKVFKVVYLQNVVGTLYAAQSYRIVYKNGSRSEPTKWTDYPFESLKAHGGICSALAKCIRALPRHVLMNSHEWTIGKYSGMTVVSIRIMKQEVPVPGQRMPPIVFGDTKYLIKEHVDRFTVQIIGGA